jgi:dienelactone hydrolase
LTAPGAGTLVGIAVLAGVLGPAPAASTQTNPAAPYQVVRPPGAGAHPALLFVSGCGGFTPTEAPDHYPRTAQAFAARGYVVVFVDYLAARGRQTCAGLIRPRDVATDILAAAAHAGSQPFVRASDISVIGWSMGGAGVLAAIGALPGDRPAPFRRAIAYYPVCYGIDTPWPAKAPLLMLLAGQDELARPSACQDLVKRLGSDQPILVRVYPSARHAFDVTDLPPLIRLPSGAPIGYDPASALAASDEVRRFLTR